MENPGFVTHKKKASTGTLITATAKAAEVSMPANWQPTPTDWTASEARTNVKTEWLNPETLMVDSAWARKISAAQVKRFAEHWDYALAGAILVHQRQDSTRVIIDGVNRTCAAINRGLEEMLCTVVYGLEVSDEPLKAADFNRNRKNPLAVEFFKMYRVAHDQTAIEIAEAVERNGLAVYEVGTHGKQEDGVVYAIAALFSLHRQGGAELIDATLSFLTSAWGISRPNFMQFVLKGTARFLQTDAAQEDFRMGDFIEYLATVKNASQADRAGRDAVFDTMQGIQKTSAGFANAQGDISGDWSKALRAHYQNMLTCTPKRKKTP